MEHTGAGIARVDEKIVEADAKALEAPLAQGSISRGVQMASVYGLHLLLCAESPPNTKTGEHFVHEITAIRKGVHRGSV